MTASADLRDCHLYRFWVRHPVTGERVLGYVGETVRQPFARLMEHIDRQPWADTIVGWEVDDVVYAGKDAVLAAEAAAIRAERPLYNIEENTGNPGRIPPWVAKRQRAERDARKRGQSVSRPPFAPPPSPRREPARRPMSRRTRNRVLVLSGWLVAAVGVWVLLAYAGAVTTAAGGASGGFGSATAGGVWLAWKLGKRRTRRLIEAGLTLLVMTAALVAYLLHGA